MRWRAMRRSFFRSSRARMSSRRASSAGGGDPDGGEFSRPVKAGQVAGVGAVGLRAHPGRRGMRAGAMTSQLTPSELSSRWVS